VEVIAAVVIDEDHRRGDRPGVVAVLLSGG